MAGEMGISGLGSGIDTKSLIRQLMAVERQPLFRMNQKVNDWKSEKNIWQQVNTKLQTLQNALNDLKLSETYTSKKVTSTDESVVAATAATTAANGVYDIAVSQLATTHSVASKSSSVDPNNYFASNSSAQLEFTVGSSKGGSQTQVIAVTINSGDTMTDVRDKINQKVAEIKQTYTDFLGVKASVVNNQLVLEGEHSGKDWTIGVNKDDLSLIYDSGTNSFVNQLQAAQNADFKINNLQVTSEETNVVSDVVDGVTFNLVKTGSATVNIDQDKQKAVDTIKKFVNAYNDAYDFIDKQRQISTKDNTSGTLKGDLTLNSILNSLWDKVTQQITGVGAYDQIAQIGIQTESFSGRGLTGKLTIDESKLNDMLGKDSDSVQKLFSNSGGTGIANVLENYTSSFIDSGTGIIPEREKIIDDQIKSMQDQIRRFSDLMDLREKTLSDQFLAMEKALSAMNAQSNWLAGQLLSLPTYSAQQTK